MLALGTMAVVTTRRQDVLLTAVVALIAHRAEDIGAARDDGLDDTFRLHMGSKGRVLAYRRPKTAYSLPAKVVHGVTLKSTRLQTLLVRQSVVTK